MEDRSSSPSADCSTSASCQEDSRSSDASSTRPLTHATELIPTVDSFFVTDVVLSQVLLLCGVLAPLGLLMFITSIPQRAFLSSSGACDPDGSFSPDRTFYTDSDFSTPYGPTGKNFNAWSRGGLFQITLGFGRLPFSTVKIIDVLWDVLVGRGGQLCLGFMAYKTFTKTLIRIMERATVTYDTFWSINIEPTSVQSIYRISRDIVKTASFRFRSAVVLMACSSAYVIAFPTAVGAMTGYSTNIAAFAPDHNNALIPFTDFVPVVYVINDGSRLKLSDRYLVSGDWQSSDSTARRYDACLGQDSNHCDFIATLSQYVNTFSLDTVHEVSSTFNLSNGMVTLDAPTLNISAFYIPEGDFTYSIGNDTSGRYRNPTQTVFAWNNVTYSRDYMINYGSCVPELPTSYKWGFSFLALWIFMLVSAVWAIGIYALWLDAYLHSRLDRQPASKRVTGSYKVALNLAKAINQNFGEAVADALTNSALKEKIRRDVDGGILSYAALLWESNEKESCTTRYHDFNQSRKSLGRWKINWWLCAGIAMAAIVIIVPISQASKKGSTDS